ncbi:DEAD-box ATP-dependent RNA helicase 50 [Monoraphidium neglectum]|uniref:DEAD-box ATP-dependent RNA helicase 50 n=1 Tax=Monoraphidium neglectum TaxID=145388 RepID=A0A0D2MMB3_9CHLO|nr:DEAD-box ATP-dependent RNA helicase 50 [Monoraphidium neglectum]KIZ01662.1 DEAD-box ATP-dependent RNA helicase 50 [Monoraphidium neglectum]|eukprot:XP_013900681.1 DEAD-box ATP-dependent RNA helicase 50 [Monoraphidium neglectum]
MLQGRRASTCPAPAATAAVPRGASGRAPARGGGRSAGRGGRGGAGGPPPPTQQQQQQRRPAPRDDDEDEFFVDDEAAAKLRQILKRRGRDALVDERGRGLVALDKLGEAYGIPDRRERRPKEQWQPDFGVEEGRGGDEEGGGEDGRGSEAASATRRFEGRSSGAAAVARPRRDAGGGAGASAGLGAAAPAGAAAGQIPVVRQNMGPDQGFFSASSWRDLGASDAVVEALRGIGITRPSHVQAESYRALVSAKARHVALADQAGSGKTLGYLLPLLQELKQEEKKTGRPATVPGSPRILIITPTGELAQQVQRVLKALVAAGLKLRSSIMTGGQEDEARRFKALKTQEDALKAGVDVMVSTPGRAVALLSKGALNLGRTNAIVLDEVDVLCGGEDVYREQVEPLQSAAPSSTRFVLVSATLPQHTFEKLREVFPGLEPAFGPGLHRVSAGERMSGSPKGGRRSRPVHIGAHSRERSPSGASFS